MSTSHGVTHDHGQTKKATASGWIGSALEYYDFFIYAQAAALVFPSIFFDKNDPKMGIIGALGTYAVGYVARPIGAFVEKTLVAAGQCTKVDREASAAAVGLLGCGVMAGFGAAVNTGGVSRGDSIAVIGCGGVGNAAIQGAKVVGATTIIAVDVDDRKLEAAKTFGATHTVNGAREDVVERVRELTGGHGADVVVEAVGRPETYEQAFYARDLAGTVVLVGVPTPDKQVTLPMIEIFGRGGALKSSWNTCSS